MKFFQAAKIHVNNYKEEKTTEITLLKVISL